MEISLRAYNKYAKQATEKGEAMMSKNKEMTPVSAQVRDEATENVHKLTEEVKEEGREVSDEKLENIAGGTTPIIRPY